MRWLDLLYRVYTKRLLMDIRRHPVPRHVGLILDGNRRYARLMGFHSVVAGHAKGAEKVEELLDWCLEVGITTVTLWVLSPDNLARPPAELDPLLHLIATKMREIATHPKIHHRQLHVRAIGRLELLPTEVRAAIAEAERATAQYQRFFLNVAVGYGGRQEIVDAFKKLLQTAQDKGVSMATLLATLSPDDLSPYLYSYDLHDPELIIRTSGELRLSGFLLWQSVYSELYFCDVFWPVFRKVDFLRAIRSFQQRERRFGS